MKYVTWHWKDDAASAAWIEKTTGLNQPETLSNKKLAEATTHIVGLSNPYAKLLVQRAGNIIPYEVAVNMQNKAEAAQILEASAQVFGLKLET